jgi:competence protein ComEA
MDGSAVPTLTPVASTAIAAGAAAGVRPALTLAETTPAAAALEPVLQVSWPQPAQWAAAALVAVAAALLGWHGWQFVRAGARPTELRRGEGLDYRVDLNRARRSELLQLPGVGTSLAERIERFRVDRGAFRNVDELRLVSGIGPAMLARLRPWVCVGRDGEEQSEPLPASSTSSAPKRIAEARRSSSQREAALKGMVIDVNHATGEQLRQLPRIGPKLSQRILDERARRPFTSVEDLRRVPGIGPKTLQGLRPYITVGQ